MTLLEKALQTKTIRNLSQNKGDNFDERLELALAYANRKISVSQSIAAGGTKGASGLGSVIVTAIRRGIIKVERVPEVGSQGPASLVVSNGSEPR
jgi:hypothetical protein